MRPVGRFRRLFSDLPLDVQRDAKRAYRPFESNPANPGLQFKKLEGEKDMYSARIGLDYRALAVMKRSRLVGYRIGSHSGFDRLIRTLVNSIQMASKPASRASDARGQDTVLG